jgi:flagellin-like protein
MNIPTPDDSGRGQVGIGTLIIFIALVLVAAVAAGVLIDTSGQLESRASDTGADAQSEVSNQIDVVSATGEIGSGVETVELVVKKSPGSDPIDLSAATIEYTSDDASVTLVEGDASASGGSEFSVTSEVDASGASGVLEDNDDRYKITISTSDIESGLSAGEDAELEIVDQSGASTIYGVNVPDVLSGTYVGV